VLMDVWRGASHRRAHSARAGICLVTKQSPNKVRSEHLYSDTVQVRSPVMPVHLYSVRSVHSAPSRVSRVSALWGSPQYSNVPRPYPTQQGVRITPYPVLSNAREHRRHPCRAFCVVLSVTCFTCRALHVVRLGQRAVIERLFGSPWRADRPAVAGEAVALVAYAIIRTTTCWRGFSAIVSENAVTMGLFVG
jgi:hypothetical protein